MRIGIDARFWGLENKGLGRYVEQLVTHLLKIDQENEYVLFIQSDKFSRVPSHPRLKLVKADIPWYGIKEQIHLPKLIREAEIDIFHAPHFNVPIRLSVPLAVTIHDLILLSFPSTRASTLGPIKFRLKFLAYRAVIKRAAKRAEQVITVSNFTKDELIKKLKVPADKIAVTYEGFQVPGSEASGINLAKKGVHKPYLLYVGNAYPHKNLDRLIDVFGSIWNESRGEYQLVLVGKKDYFYNRLEDKAKKIGLVKKEGISPVVFYDYATNQELPSIYKQASLYVFPSLMEGFGLPALEAMQFNLPVVASQTGSIPEIVGDAALLFDPNNNQEMEETILKGLNDKTLRDQLINRGQERIKKFDWTKCAEQTLEIYSRVYTETKKHRN